MSAKKKTNDESLSFESAIERLEEIVEKLEAGDLPLDDSLKLFEEGVKLSRFCNTKLEEVEHKIEILTKERDAEGNIIAEPFEESTNS